MKFVFFGSPIFARLVFEELVAANTFPEIIVCNPDRPAGRHQTVTPPEIKKYVLEKRLPIEIVQPEDLSDIADRLSGIKPEFFVVAAYGKIIKKNILDIPRLSAIGIHSSLLPKYRGTSPIHGAILAGEKETGATLFMMDEKMDHGPILAQYKVSISQNDTHETLFPKIWSGGGRMLVEILPKLLQGKIRPKIQDETKATYTKKFTSADGFIELRDLEEALGGNMGKSIAIDRKIRAFAVEPGVWTLKDGKRMKLLAAELQNGKLVLKIIQNEGQKPVKL